MIRHSILVICSEPPKAIGAGAAVRSYFFVRELTKRFHVVLAIASPQGGAVDESLSEGCYKILTLQSVAARADARMGRLDTLRSILCGFGEWPSGLYRLAPGLGINVYSSAQPQEVASINLRWSQKALRALVRIRLALEQRFGRPIPAQCLPLWHSFRAMIPVIKNEVAKGGFDAIWWEHSFLFPLADELAKQQETAPVLCCNTHNIERELLARQAVHEKDPPERRWLVRQSYAMARVERRAFRHCDLVLCCSEHDRSLVLKDSPRTRCEVAPNGVDLAYFRSRETGERAHPPTVLFTGTMSYRPNRDAVEFFVEEILPKARESVPALELVVAGRGCRDFEAGFPGHGTGLRFVDSPDDMRPLFESAWAVVVPLRSGGGTRLKILEAMAMGRAVVSTSCGAEGVPYVDGRDLLLRDDPSRFAEAVIELVRDPAKRRQLERNAQAFVQEYDWQMIARRAVSQFEECVEARADGSGVC